MKVVESFQNYNLIQNNRRPVMPVAGGKSYKTNTPVNFTLKKKKVKKTRVKTKKSKKKKGSKKKGSYK